MIFLLLSNDVIYLFPLQMLPYVKYGEDQMHSYREITDENGSGGSGGPNSFNVM